MLVPTYQCWPSVATGLPASQCLLVPHLSIDSSLSFASKIIFLHLFRSFLVVLSYSSADVSIPGLVSTGLPASQCLPMHVLFTDISQSFLPKIVFSGLFQSVLVLLSYASANVLMPAPCSNWSACLTMLAGATFMH